MKEFIRFKNNNKEYILLNDNGNLIYATYNKGNILTNIDKEEKELLKQVFINLLPSKKIIKLSNIKYKNKEINHLYDIEKSFHLFFEEDFKFNEYTLKLNYLYNNQNEFYASTKNNFLNQEIKRIVKIGKKSLVVSVSLGMLLSINITNLNNFSNALATDESFIEEVIVENRSVDEIINAILNNQNLCEEEKKLFLSNTKYIMDNLDNFDYYTILDNLNNLYIEYIDAPCRESVSINGSYYHSGEEKYKIKIYNASSFEDSNKSVLTHEFLHAFTSHGTVYKYYEIINVIINNEYYGNNSSSYDISYKKIKKYMYMLSEIVGRETLMKCHANNNEITLVNNLVKIIPNPELAYELLFKIDKILIEKDFNVITNLNEEIISILINYYETKYKTSYKDNLNMYILVDQEEAYRFIGENLGYEGLELDSIVNNIKIKNSMRIFDIDGETNLVLSIPNEFKEREYYITLEEILDGYTNYNFKSEEEITLPKLEDGSYVGITLDPISYIDYIVPNIEYKISNNIK